MAALKKIASEYADELRDGIAWVIVWKTGRSWNSTAVWLNSDDDTFEPEDLDQVQAILTQDPNAVMLNGYYCGHFGEDMNVAELANGIRWNYENGYNRLNNSSAIVIEPMDRPDDLPPDMPWYGRSIGAEPDPYVYDGFMSIEDYDLMHKQMKDELSKRGGDNDRAGTAWSAETVDDQTAWRSLNQRGPERADYGADRIRPAGNR